MAINKVFGKVRKFLESDDLSGETDMSLKSIHNVKLIDDVNDLPNATNGTHTLEDDYIYRFNGFIASQSGLELGRNTPIIGGHGGVDGFICTGGGPAITGDGENLLMRNIYAHCPFGQLFDISGTTSEEVLVESCSFSDAAELGNIANLGVFYGMRVPSFKGCNFEEFDSGLTFTGSPNKIFFAQTPFRNVTEDGVSIITLSSDLDVAIVDMAGNYVKSVQPNTKVIDVEAGGEPTEILQYRGFTHDTTFDNDNGISGALNKDSVGVKISDSYPIRDWVVSGDLQMDNTETVTAPTNPTKVDGPTTLRNPIRTSSPNNGEIQYDAKDETAIRVFVNASISGNNTTVSGFIGKNGNDVERSQTKVETQGSGTEVTMPVTTNLTMTTGDTTSLYIRNDDGNGDIEVETMSITMGPA
jgi:hypothetical protein